MLFLPSPTNEFKQNDNSDFEGTKQRLTEQSETILGNFGVEPTLASPEDLHWRSGLRGR